MTRHYAHRTESQVQRIERLQATLNEIQRLIVQAKLETADLSDCLLVNDIDRNLRKALVKITEAEFHVW